MKNLHLSKEHFFRQPRFESNISASQHLQYNPLGLFIDLRIVCIGGRLTEVVGYIRVVKSCGLICLMMKEW